VPVRPMPEYRRRLPHFQPEETYLFLTWRLWVSLPKMPASVPHPNRRPSVCGSKPGVGPSLLRTPLVKTASDCRPGRRGDSDWRGRETLLRTRRLGGHAQSRAPADPTQGSGTGADEMAKGIDCTKCQFTSRTNRATVLAGRVIRPLRAPFDTTRPNHRLHRGEPCVSRTGQLGRALAVVQRGLAGATACPTQIFLLIQMYKLQKRVLKYPFSPRKSLILGKKRVLLCRFCFIGEDLCGTEKRDR
jgi:hypothetical protein